MEFLKSSILVIKCLHVDERSKRTENYTFNKIVFLCFESDLSLVLNICSTHKFLFIFLLLFCGLQKKSSNFGVKE